MSPIDAFKVSFLLKCAQDGCTIPQTRDRILQARSRMTKRAWPESLTIPGYDTISKVVEKLTPWAITSLATAPVAVGGLGGYLAANAHSDNFDTDDALKEEEASAYQDAIKQMQQVERQQTQRKKMMAHGMTRQRTV